MLGERSFEMKFKDKINQFFFLEEDDMELDEMHNESTQSNQNTSENNRHPVQGQRNVRRTNPASLGGNQKQTENKVVSIKQHPSQKPKIKIVEPRTYSEVRGIADLVLQNFTVLLNFRRIEKEQAKKILDFLMGTVYAIDGDIQRIGEEIFVCTPSNVEIDGTELDSMSSTEYY